MAEREELSKVKMVNEILHIPHGKLETYIPVCKQAVAEEPELFAHLVAWNHKKSEVRDSKVAFPVIALRGGNDKELYENAVAHLCLLDPRNLVRAIQFHKEMNKNSHKVKHGAGNMLELAIEKYLKEREKNKNWWASTAVQHRKNLKALYALYHVKPNRLAQAVLFDRKKPTGTIFEAIAQLKHMSPQEAAGTILNYKIPFLVAVGALGGIKNKPDVIMALMDRMSGNELITNTEMFKKLGVFASPVLNLCYSDALERAKKDKRTSTLKAGRAAEQIIDTKVKEKMLHLQEEKLEQLGGIEGDWLVLGDRSGSMHHAVEMAKVVASLIAQQVKGSVYLVFFNTTPTRYDATGKTLDEIKDMTKRVSAHGGTSIGCGLDLLRASNITVNGIAIVSDGGDNTAPLFPNAYRKYMESMGVEPTVYHFWLPGDNDALGYTCKLHHIPVQKFDVSRMDYYSLPGIVQTMRVNRFTLVQEIMDTPLLTLDKVFKGKAF